MKSLSLILLLLLPLAASASWPFKEAPYLYLGVELERNSAGIYGFCREGHNLVSNMGVAQGFNITDRISGTIQLTHHSCVVEARDNNVYDAVGASMRWSFW